jgi:hypothetical protein
MILLKESREIVLQWENKIMPSVLTDKGLHQMIIALLNTSYI